jgi:DNA topoisomerase-1
MASARLERTSVDLSDGTGKTVLRATGQVVKFPGFLALYDEGRDDAEDEDARLLPAMGKGDAPAKTGVEVESHETQPPPRYSEASLVKKMEELGIGRPSTYASTLAVLQERDYVRIDKKRLVPEDKGRLVIAFLESFFKKYVEFDFTASLEEKLDLISSGEMEYKAVLRDFWRDFAGAIDGIKDLRVGEVLEALNELLGPHVFSRSRCRARTAPSSAAATTRTANTHASSRAMRQAPAATASSASIPTAACPCS